MSYERNKMLAQKFRSTALDRIRRMTAGLIELSRGGDGAAELFQEVGREMHTLKGEARMVGFAALTEVAHEAEGVLKRGGHGTPPEPAACQLLIEVLEGIARFLISEPQDERILASTRALLAERGGGTPSARTPAPPAPPPSAEAKPVAPIARGSTPFLQVEARRLDELCERLTELEGEYRLLQSRLGAAVRNVAEGRRLRPLVDEADRCRARLDEIGVTAWSLRLVPAEPVLTDLAGYARDLAISLGKRVRVTVSSPRVEIERSVLDALWDPLLHLVRNAVDHGVEPPGRRGGKPEDASLVLHGESVGPHVRLVVADDGAGVDLEAVRRRAVERGVLSASAAASLDERGLIELLFHHGFSTRDEVGELSGRGIGLDVVRTRVEGMGGRIAVEGGKGRGMRFTLEVPARVARERTLVIRCGEVLYGLPCRQIAAVLDLTMHATEPLPGGTALRYRDEPLPLRSLGALVGAAAGIEGWAAVLEGIDGAWVVSFPEIVGEFDVLRRPVDGLVDRAGIVGASALLDDGRLVLLLRPPELQRRWGQKRRTGAPGGGVGGHVAPDPFRVLVVDDSPVVRSLLVEALRRNGFDTDAAEDGQAALDAIGGRPPDLLLTDLEMPRMGGLELVRTVRAGFPDLPIVMLSARGGPDDVSRGRQAGADAYLVKSQFEEGAFVAAVRRFVALRPRITRPA